MLYLRFSLAILSVFLVPMAASAQELSQPAPYTLPNTEVFPLRSEGLDQIYEIRVALPDGYRDDEAEGYPLLVLLDADYSFAIARNVTQHLSQRGQLPEMIVVAIAYPGAENDRDHYRMTRSRDYTPTFWPEGGYGPAFQEQSGGGPAFLDFISDQLLPEIETRYSIHPNDRTLSGHSYGGLFTTWALLTRPDLFSRWVIVSPSYWYADEYIFECESEFAEAHNNLDEVVFIGVGEWENGPNLPWQMVDLMTRFVEVFGSREYQRLSLDSYIFEDNTHASVWPAAISRGLRSVFNEPLPANTAERASDNCLRFR